MSGISDINKVWGRPYYTYHPNPVPILSSSVSHLLSPIFRLPFPLTPPSSSPLLEPLSLGGGGGVVWGGGRGRKVDRGGRVKIAR